MEVQVASALTAPELDLPAVGALVWHQGAQVPQATAQRSTPHPPGQVALVRDSFTHDVYYVSKSSDALFSDASTSLPGCKEDLLAVFVLTGPHAGMQCALAVHRDTHARTQGQSHAQSRACLPHCITSLLIYCDVCLTAHACRRASRAAPRLLWHMGHSVRAP